MRSGESDGPDHGVRRRGARPLVATSSISATATRSSSTRRASPTASSTPRTHARPHDRVDGRHALARRLRLGQPRARSARRDVPRLAPAPTSKCRTATRATATRSSSRDGLVLRAIATPGHTPDHLAYLLVEDGEPVALFSGGSLMVGTVGRTDLLGPEPRDDLTRAAVPRAARPDHDAARRPARLPDPRRRLVLLRARRDANAPRRSDASARRTRCCAIDDEDTFVDARARRPRHVPAVLLTPARGEPARPAPLRRAAGTRRARPRRVPRRDRATARSSSTPGRSPRSRQATCRGALSIELRPVFASWLGWLVDAERRLVFVLDDDQDTHELVRQCLDVGYEHLVGVLDGGMRTWTDAGLPIAIDPARRTRRDRRHGHRRPPGATSSRPATCPARRTSSSAPIADATLPDGPVTVMCGHGERAMTAASVLEAHGRTRPRVLVGGPDDWATATGAAARVPRERHRHVRPIRLGLRENLAQFSLLVGVNALVGGMIGQERTVLPLLADQRVRAHRVHRDAHVHRRVRRGEGARPTSSPARCRTASAANPSSSPAGSSACRCRCS